MSVTQVPLRPLKAGSMLKLWLGIVLLIAAAVALAWIGAGSLRGETTPSGVMIRTVEAGKGPTIGQQDVVQLAYVGTLDDGSVFDSSQGRAVPLTPMAVIPGFAEALVRMQKGGHYKFRLPASMGYGAEAQPGIPANSRLNFEVQIADVIPGAGPILLQQMQRQQMQQMGGEPQGAPPPGQPAN